MFRALRLRLSLLYLGAALLLIALIGAGTYQLIDHYFQTVTDLGLQHRMAHEFQERGLALPPELATADRDWARNGNNPYPPPGGPAAGPHGGPGGHGVPAGNEGVDPDQLDGNLAAIFVLPLDAHGAPAGTPPPFASALAAQGPACAQALSQGLDWRTTTMAGDTRVRLLTYRLPPGAGPAALQVGRTLADQDQVLHQLLISLLALGLASAVLLGLGSWALAGRALRPAQAAWARQQVFVANASHELRTPLTLLRASAEVARRELATNPADARELLADVLQETDHMGRLVEDLLLLSRLDAGQVPIAHETIPLAGLLDDVQRQVGRVAAEKGVRVAVTGAPGTAWGDPTRLRQVLLILLDNALRYTPPGGGITLAARPHGRFVHITVADTGSGIAAAHLPHLFERFYRVDDARGGDGAGLGLGIAQGLIGAQHGQIAVESRPGAGTRVTLTLPVAPFAHESAPAAEAGAVVRRRGWLARFAGVSHAGAPGRRAGGR